MLIVLKRAVLACALVSSSAAQAENVEVYLADMLDNTQTGYCLDIAKAQGDAANPDDGLQGHTCYSPSGELGVDQAFDADQFVDGVLYMPEFDVCAEVVTAEVDGVVGLAACDASAAQSFVFSGEGSIVPSAAPDLCLTLENATRTGRSDANQIKVLSLAACDADLAGYQDWAVRTAGN